MAGYTVALLYTEHKETEKEIRETSPFTIATNNKISWGNTDQRNKRPVRQEP